MSVFTTVWFLTSCLFYVDSSLALSFSVCLSMYFCVERIFYRGLKIRCFSVYCLFFSALFICVLFLAFIFLAVWLF